MPEDLFGAPHKRQRESEQQEQQGGGDTEMEVSLPERVREGEQLREQRRQGGQGQDEQGGV